MEGTRAPRAMGMSHDTAPQKHEMQFFNASFGMTGMDGKN